MSLREHYITTVNGESFTPAEHGALARLVFKRFGGDLTSATYAWQRLLQNGATEADFREILEWGLTPEPTPPDPTLDVTLVAWKGLREITVKTVRDYLDQMNPFGFISRVEITEFKDIAVSGNVTVDSFTDGQKTHRFHLHLEGDYTTLSAFGRSKRFR